MRWWSYPNRGERPGTNYAAFTLCGCLRRLYIFRREGRIDRSSRPVKELAMIRHAFVTLTLALAAGLSVSSAAAQTPPNTVQLQPSPDIPGVIKGGTMPEVVIKGLTSSDDPMWVPNIGLIFSEKIKGLTSSDDPMWV